MYDSKIRSIGIFSFLLLLILATRADHFGSAINLPDASLSVFFMAGFTLPSRWAFPAFCVVAAAIDYWIIKYNGVSAFCVTPAYGFLLPTYFVIWGAGIYCARINPTGFAQWLKVVVIATVAITCAHLISSGSFYLLAPYFPSHSLAEFGERTARYFPRYFIVTSSYIVLLLALWKLAIASKTVTSNTRSGNCSGISHG